jgi:hypothetical protein
MASLPNLTIGILHAHRACNIAAALRRNTRDATRSLALLGSTAHEPTRRHVAEALGRQLTGRNPPSPRPLVMLGSTPRQYR